MPSAATEGEREVIGLAFDGGNLHPQGLEAARTLVVADVVGAGSLVVLEAVLEYTTMVVGGGPVVHVTIVGKAFHEFRRLERARTNLYECTISVLIKVLVGGVEHQLAFIDGDALATVGNLVAIGAQEYLAVLSHAYLAREIVAQSGFALLGHHGHEVAYQVSILIDLEAVHLHVATRVVATMTVGAVGVQVEDVHLVHAIVGNGTFLTGGDDGSRLALALTGEAHRATLGNHGDALVHGNLVRARLLVALVAFKRTAVAALVAGTLFVGTIEHHEGVALPVAVACAEDGFPVLGGVLRDFHVGHHTCCRLVDVARVDETSGGVQAGFDVLDVLLYHRCGNLQVGHVLINAVAFILFEVVQHVDLSVGLVQHIRIRSRVGRQVIDDCRLGCLCESSHAQQQTHCE